MIGQRRVSRPVRTLIAAATLSLVACGGDDESPEGATTTDDTTTTADATTTTEETTTTVPPTTVPPTPTMPSGDPVFPGYPLLVPIGSIDSRVASWLADNVVDGQVVALAPGVYVPYNPNVPDLMAYMGGPNDGDCIMRETFFPNSGGACWTGVQPGSAEP